MAVFAAVLELLAILLFAFSVDKKVRASYSQKFYFLSWLHFCVFELDALRHCLIVCFKQALNLIGKRGKLYRA